MLKYHYRCFEVFSIAHNVTEGYQAVAHELAIALLVFSLIV